MLFADEVGCSLWNGELGFRERMSPMMNSNSAEMREWAARCEELAAAARDEKERAGLLRKCDALRALANSEDWLAGVLPSAPASI